MLNIRKFKVCIDIKNGELTCPNPTIILKKHKDLLQNCELKDGCIEFSILQEDEDKLKGVCIPYTIICDDCGHCPPKDGEICFCDSNADCDTCSNCIGGICSPKCPKECDNGTCVDCTEGSCPGNQECIDGKCDCPPNKPYKGANGICYGCENDTQCPPCYRCDGAGNCVPRDCGSGQCDPRLDKCVECVDSAVCKTQDPNKCCVNNKCECCTGFRLNPATGRCEPLPECTSSEDCPDCTDCVAGKCAPIVCPEGFKCDGSNDCIPDPCKSSPCENGTDCGPLCGCLEETCSECSKLTCVDCDAAKGCKCNPQTGKCEKVVDCDNPCVSKFDCGSDCGCDESTCKDCANYTCAECGSIPGCKCNTATGQCEGDGTPRGGDGSGDGCPDTFTVEKDPNCQTPRLIATLKKDVACNCDPINFNVSAPSGINNSFTVTPKKQTVGGLINYSQAGSPLTSDKEFEVTSIYKIIISGTYKSIVNGVAVSPDPTFYSEQTVPAIKDFRNSFNISPITASVSNFTSLVKATISIEHTSTDFSENKCKYGKQTIFSDSELSNFSFSETTGTISYKAITPKSATAKATSDVKRDPLFVWYEDLNTIVKREFVTGTTTYISYLEPALYKTKKSYKVTNDCSCKKEAFYIWDCEKEKYFETADISYEIVDCGKTFRLLSVTPPCNPLHREEVYKLFVNGQFFVNVVSEEALPIEVTHQGGINSIYVIVDKTDCKKDYPVEKQDTVTPKIEKDCNLTNGKTIFRIYRDIPNSTVQVSSVSWGIAGSATNNPQPNVVSSQGSLFTFESDENATIRLSYSNGCKDDTIDLTVGNCCDNCKPTIGGAESTKVLFVAAGTKGDLQISNSCNYNGTTYSSSNELIASVDNTGKISYTTPNNNLEVDIEVAYTATCKKTVKVIFEKVGLNLTLTKENGCDNPELNITGQAATGTEFKVKSVCSGQDVWTGTWSGTNLSKVVQQTPDLCEYELVSVGGVNLPQPVKVTYNKLNLTTTALSITQQVDSCSDNAAFEVAPHSINLEGYLATYSIDNGANLTSTITRIDSKNILNISRSLLVNNDCSVKSLRVLNAAKDISCVIPYNQNIPLFLKCTIDFSVEKKCEGDKKVILITGPDYINRYSLLINGSNTPEFANTIESISTGVRVFKYLSNIDTTSATITPEGQGQISYCQKTMSFPEVNCNKINRIIDANLSGCLSAGNTLNLSTGSRTVAIRDIRDLTISGKFTTDPNEFNNNANIKYLVTLVNNGVSVPTNIAATFVQAGVTPGTSDAVFVINTIDNFGPNLKMLVQTKEDNVFLANTQLFNIVNSGSLIAPWDTFTLVTQPSAGGTQYSAMIAPITATLNPVTPTFFIVNPAQLVNITATYYNQNNELMPFSEVKQSYSLPLSTFIDNPSTATFNYFNPPQGATKVVVCREINGCSSCFEFNIEMPSLEQFVFIYTSCGTGTQTVKYYDQSIQPIYIKYLGTCYVYTDSEPLQNQTGLINSSNLEDYTESFNNWNCTSSICQNNNVSIVYTPCGGGPPIYLPINVDAPVSPLYNGICYQRGEQSDVTPNVDWNDIGFNSYDSCEICSLVQSEPNCITNPSSPCSCGVFDIYTNTYVQNSAIDCDFGDCQKVGNYWICQ